MKLNKIYPLYLLLFSFSFAFVLYLLTCPPLIYSMDSGEFSATAFLLGIPHAPSYPLYIILVKLFTFLPVGHIAFRANYLSIVFSSLTTFNIFFLFVSIAKFLFHKKTLNLNNIEQISLLKICALFSALFYTISNSIWYQSQIAEEYALHCFLISLLILIIINWGIKVVKNTPTGIEKKRTAAENLDFRYFCLIALVSGISISNHLLTLAYASAILFFIIYLKPQRLFSVKGIIFGSFFFLLGVSVYQYIIYRAAAFPLINWGFADNFRNFKYLVTLEETTQMYPVNRIFKTSSWYPFLGGGIYQDLYLFFPFLLLIILKIKKQLQHKIFKIVFTSLITVSIYALVLVPYLDPFVKSRFSASFISDIFLIVLTFFITSLILITTKTIKFNNQKILISTAILLVILAIAVKVFKYNNSIFLTTLYSQFGFYLFFLIPAGGYFLYHKNKLLTFFLLYCVMMSLIFTVVTNFPHNNPVLQERHKITAYIILALFLGYSFFYIFLKKNISFTIAVVSLFILFSVSLAKNFPQQNRKYFYAYDFAYNVMNSLPANSILFVKGTEHIFPLWYLEFGEKFKKNITLVFIDAISNPWYVKHLQQHYSFLFKEKLKPLTLKKWSKTSMQERGEYTKNVILQIIDKNLQKRKIFYLADIESFVIEGIKPQWVNPYGLVMSIDKNTKKITADRLKNIISNYNLDDYIPDNIDWVSRYYISLYANCFYYLANSYLNEGKENLAKQYFKKSLFYNSTHLGSIKELGLLYLKEKNLELAEKYFLKAKKLDSFDPVILNNLANVYINKDDLKKAIPLLEKAIEISPDYANAHFNLAMAYAQQGLKYKAIEEFTTTLQINKNDVQARYLLALSYLNLKKIKEATQELETIINIAPKNAGIAFEIAKIYYQLGNKEKAIQLLKKVVKLQPQNFEAKNILSELNQ